MVAATSRASVFHAVADPTRRRMLDLLLDTETPACDLVRHFNVSQPAVSQHLKVLRDAGLVEVRRDGRQRLYRTNAARLKPVFDWVARYEQFWNEKLKSLGKLLDRD